MSQPSLFEVDLPDAMIPGTKPITIKYPDHPNPLMRKPFISWDGEGYTDEFGQHHYWLLANSLGDRIIAPPGRSLERATIARLFTRTKLQYPDAINTGFALGYDFTCILRSNGFKSLDVTKLYDKQYFTASGFVWRVLMGKMLSVRRDGDSGNAFTLQDSWGFFQKSFINALDEYFNKDWPYRDIIVEMKAQRSHFDREHDDDVIYYNDCELELHVMLMEELRTRLYDAGMPVQNWYGPGAIASGLLNQWKIKDTLLNLYEVEPDVAEAARYAYAGGRFELVKPGHMNQPVYQYDINSAYPWAIAQLPNLRKGKWIHVSNIHGDVPADEFAVYRVSVEYNPALDDLAAESIPYPLWRRDHKGNISYPSNYVEGWFWACEVAATLDYLHAINDYCDPHIVIHEGWIFSETGHDRPFKIVNTLYENRQKLKALGNGAHVGIKLGLNSLYGKLAQQIGYQDGGKLPPFHNLALAGWVTAMCRAKMIHAMSLNPESIIAFETDGIFSLAELDLPVSKNLGDWERTRWDDMYYFASGFRFGLIDDEVKKPATRGIPVKDITLEAILDQVKNSRHRVTVDQQQFISIRWALSLNKPEQAGQWKVTTKELQLMCENKQGKRIHDEYCPACVGNNIREYNWDKPHYTIPQWNTLAEPNYAHKVAWINESPIDILEREMDGGFMFDLEGE